MTDDKYRKIIFNAQVYANTGAGTYQKAVDMATKDFLSAGINCIEYKNGRRVPIDVYAEMAIRTANKRAYLQGEGEMRKKWGIHTVIMNKRTNPCPKCAPFVGKVIVDDVWSGGTAEEAEEKGYLLMSDCIKRGLYHPNCQDSHTTYFGDILDEEDEENTEEQEQTEGEPETNDKGVSETDTSKNAESLTEDGVRQMPLTEESEYFARENGYDSTVPTSENQITPREQRINEQLYDAEQRQNYCERQVQRFERMSKYSLDKDNQRIYKARKSEWKEKKKEVDLQINEIKREINKAQNKVIRPRIKSLALASSDPVRLTNYSLNISPDIEKKNENNSPQEVANSGNGGIIESGKTKKCYIHPDKVNKFLLLPGAKHSKDFFDVGYTPDDHDLLVSDITKEYNYGKAVEKRQKGNAEQFSIFMYLGKTVKKRFRVVWQKDTPDSIPRMITAHRED